MNKFKFIALVACCLALFALTGCTRFGVNDDAVPTSFENLTDTQDINIRTVQYKQIDNVDSNLLSLDVYYKSGIEKAPIVFYVHGGGLIQGDKRNSIEAKSTYFVENGYVFVSVNYRLSPDYRFPAHISDVADAFMVVYNNAEEYGAENSEIYVMGHSAGAYLVTLLSTNEKYITEAGGSLDMIKGCISLDHEQYNTPLEGFGSCNIDLIVGEESNVYDATPIEHVEANKGIPPFLTFYCQSRASHMEYQQPFIDKCAENAIPAANILASGDSHEEVNSEIGMVDDVKTQIVMKFLDNPSNVVKIAEKYNYTA